jgi:hypothetical protein
MWILERGRQNSKLSHSILGGQAGRKFWVWVLFPLVPSYHGFAFDERDTHHVVASQTPPLSLRWLCLILFDFGTASSSCSRNTIFLSPFTL